MIDSKSLLSYTERQTNICLCEMHDMVLSYATLEDWQMNMQIAIPLHINVLYFKVVHMLSL